MYFQGAQEEKIVFITEGKSYQSPYKDTWRWGSYLMPDSSRLQPSCLCFSFFLYSPFRLTPFTCGTQCCQIVLAWGRRDYACVQSLITSLRIDYYSSGLAGRGVTEEATENTQLLRGDAAVCMWGWVNIVMWSQACLLQSDRRLCPPPRLSHLFTVAPSNVVFGQYYRHMDAEVTNIPASSTVKVKSQHKNSAEMISIYPFYITF